MAFRFLHAADIHLGFAQYGSRERFADFQAAFDQIVDYAVEHKVDCVILAGDLFHKRIIDPRTLFWATQSFLKLQRAGIKAVAVQGNHEMPDPRHKVSWLYYLARMGLVITLDPEYRNQKPQLTPYDAKTATGAYYDITPDVRIWGVKYVGASIRRVLEDLTKAHDSGDFEPKAYTIGVLHAGLQGILDHYGGSLSRADLDTVRPLCDYLALGHIHKPYEQDDWIYNPGSSETNSMDEWFFEGRGFYDVTVNETTVDGQKVWRHEVRKVETVKRPFISLPLQVSPYETPKALLEAVDRLVSHSSTGQRRPVVELRLTGVLAFDRALLDRDAIEERLRATFDPIVCRVKDNTQPTEYEFDLAENLSPEQLERTVLEELVANDATKRAQAKAWADLVLSCKRLALGGNDPKPLLDEVEAFCASLDRQDVACEEDASC